MFPPLVTTDATRRAATERMPAGNAPLDLTENLDCIHVKRVERGSCGVPSGENQARLVGGAHQGAAKIADKPKLLPSFVWPGR